jgi:hypothetical protein
MAYRPSSFVQHAWLTPPRCLAQVKADPLKDPPADIMGSDDLACFQIACTCGSMSWHILGHRQMHPDTRHEIFLAPLSVQCERCARAFQLFDILTHGYDAEYGGCWSLRGGDPLRWVCRQCGGHVFTAYPCFSYQVEAEDFGPAQAAHVEDFFDWFHLNVRCTACGALDTPVDYECA